MASKIAKFFFQSSLLLVLLFGLSLKGFSTGAELIAFSVLLLLCVGSLVTYKTSGKNMLFVIYSLFIIDILVLWLPTNSLYFTLLLVSLLGLLISVPRRGRKVCEDRTCEPMASTPPPQKIVEGKVVPKAAETKVEAKETVAPAKATFTPGKYVASKRSNVYHEPRCEWAKKIQKARRVWFVSREEALNKGYKKHDCVK